jgi:hypothetical protein
MASEVKQRSAFIGRYGPADWLSLKQEVVDEQAFQLEGILPLIEARARHQLDLEILDCGTGEGYFAERLHRVTGSSRIIGLDNYRPYLKKAKSIFPYSPTAYLEADIYKMPFADATFDIVASQSTFDILSGELMFKEMMRVLKPMGWLYISMAYDSSYPFAPEFDRDVEERIRRNFDLYAMEWGQRGDIQEGDSRCGRSLWHYAQKYGLKALCFTVSDWMLYPSPEYSAKEKAILHLLLDLYYQASKRATPEHAIAPSALEDWRQKLQGEIDCGRLICIIHQNSLLAEKPLCDDSES